MKKNIPILICLLWSFLANAQYCGTLTDCINTDTSIHSIYPVDTALPPLVNGDSVNIYINIYGSDTMTFGSHSLLCDSFVLDSIIQLPEGLCWSVNQLHQTYYQGVRGCIKISGVPCVPPGQYSIPMLWEFYVPIGIRNSTYYRLRIINRGDSIVPVDTSRAVEGQGVLYGPPASCYPLGIYNKAATDISIKISPNPVIDHALITVNGITGKYDFELYDFTGRLCYRDKEIAQSSFQLNRNNLAAGAYWYRIVSAEKQIATGKLIME